MLIIAALFAGTIVGSLIAAAAALAVVRFMVK